MTKIKIDTYYNKSVYGMFTQIPAKQGNKIFVEKTVAAIIK